MATIRSVTADWGTLTGDPSAGQKVRYELDRSSFTADLIIDHGHTEDTIEEDGTTATDLWTNLEGLVPSRYTVTFPKGDQYGFHLPVGDDPISLMELLLEQSIPWQPPMLSDFIDAAIEGVYAAFANTIELPLGDALVGTRADETGATGRTVHDALAERLSVKDFGAVGDGTDDTDAFAAAISAAVASGRPLLVPKGDYALLTWVSMVLTAPLTLIGDDKDHATITGPGAGTVMFLEPHAGLVLRDLTFADWFYTIYASEGTVAHDLFSVRDVRFRDSYSGIIANTSNSTAGDWFDPAVVVKYLELIDVEIIDMARSAFVWQLAFDACNVQRVHVRNARSRGIQIGRNFNSTVIPVGETEPTWDTDDILAFQQLYRAIRIRDCLVENLHNTGNETIHHIIAYGRDVVIQGNVVRDTESTAYQSEIGGIYAKAVRRVFADNIVADLRHAEFTDEAIPRPSVGTAFYINVKGSARLAAPTSFQGYSALVHHNHSYCNSWPRTIGLRIQNEDVIATHNMIERPGNIGIYVSSGDIEGDSDPDILGAEGYDHLLIQGNEIYGDPALPGIVGISCATVGDDVTIKDNMITGVYTGIRMAPHTATPQNHSIESNKISMVTDAGIRLEYGITTRNVQVINNMIDVVTSPPASPSATGIGIYVAPIAFDNADHTIVPDPPAEWTTPFLRHVRIAGNMITRLTPGGTGTGIYVLPNLGDAGLTPPKPPATVENLTIERNIIDTVQPGGSGYGIRFAGTAVVALRLQDNILTNSKTTNILYSTQPTTWAGEREFSGAWTPSNPPSLADNAVQFTTLAAPGAAPGDHVSVNFVETTPSGNNVAGIDFLGSVKAADVITVTMVNRSGAARDLAAGTIRARVRKPS